jgi:hypothetical protein
MFVVMLGSVLGICNTRNYSTIWIFMNLLFLLTSPHICRALVFIALPRNFCALQAERLVLRNL